MALILVSDVEAYLGRTLDSADSIVYSDIIDAVSLWVEYYCDTKFDDDIYSQKINIIDNHFHLRNYNRYFYGTYFGVQEVITITAPNILSSIQIDEAGDTLSLINTFTKTDIDMSELTLSSLITAINLVSGWTSALTSSSINNVFAKTLYTGSFKADIDNSNQIGLLGANDEMDVSRVSRNLYQSSLECSSGVAIYQGGYEEIPADLKDAVIRFVISSYYNRDVSNSAIGNKKSEKVGDYAYTNGDYSGSGVGGYSYAGGNRFADLAIEYKSVLDYYAINKGI